MADAHAESHDRIQVLCQPVGAGTAIEMGPEATRLKLQSSLKLRGRLRQFAGTNQRSTQGIVLPAGSSGFQGGLTRGCSSQVTSTQRLRMALTLVIEHNARTKHLFCLIEHVQSLVPQRRLLIL